MKVNPELLAPCGLYCGVCSIYRADKQNNEKLKQKLAKAYWCKPEQIECDGCLSDNKYFYCEQCNIRACVHDKGLSGCHQCADWPCSHVENYPFPLANKFMKKSIPARKERSDEEWIEWEVNNWTCKSCGAMAFRGARRCPDCKVDLPSILE